MNHKFKSVGPFISTSYKPFDIVTKPGLAVSPSDALALAERGIPVSAVNADKFFDGEDAPSWSVSPERARGVDPADLWNAQRDSRRKIKNAHLNEVAFYGESPITKTV